jgi:glycosyltransferase involved in cell wall biosynthesis
MSFQIELDNRFLLQKEYLGDDKPINRITPLVSVTVTAYQHVNYIKECLDGILMQKTNFEFEIIIGEDESTDGTRDLCIEYAVKYPEKVRLFLRDRKLSQYYENNKLICRFNGRWNRKSCRGKYIAWCDGDDYWTDPLKLQKQVDFLDVNEEYGLVYTEFDRYYQTSRKTEKDCFHNYLEIYPNTFEDFLINTRFLAPVTWVYRKASLELIDFHYKKDYVVGDLPILLTLSKYYKIGYINESTAVYRVLQYSDSHFKDYYNEYKFELGIFKIQIDFAIAFNVHQHNIFKIKNKFYPYMFTAACLVNDIEVKNDAYHFLKENKILTTKMEYLFHLSRYSILRKIFETYLNLKSKN